MFLTMNIFEILKSTCHLGFQFSQAQFLGDRCPAQVLQNVKQFWSLKGSHRYGIFMVFHHGTGCAQALTSCGNVTMAIVKTIEIAAYLPYKIT